MSGKQKKLARLPREKKPDEQVYFYGLVACSFSSLTGFLVEKRPLALAKEVKEEAEPEGSLGAIVKETRALVRVRRNLIPFFLVVEINAGGLREQLLW